MKHPLHQYREQKRLTQQALADMLGCSQSLIAFIEAGKREVSRAKAEEWERVTGINRMSLLFPAEYPVESSSERRVQ